MVTGTPSIDMLTEAHTAAQQVLTTMVDFCRHIGAAAKGHADATRIVTECLTHWGTDCNRLRQALEGNNVREFLSSINQCTVRPFETEAASHHSAVLVAGWYRLRLVQAMCGIYGERPADIDPQAISPPQLHTLADAMTGYSEIDHNAASIALCNEYQAAARHLQLK